MMSGFDRVTVMPTIEHGAYQERKENKVMTETIKPNTIRDDCDSLQVILKVFVHELEVGLSPVHPT